MTSEPSLGPPLRVRETGFATNAHIRLAAPATTGGATMLRRGWSYHDGLRPDGTPDAGMLFLAWQSDPRTGFIPVRHRLAR